MATERVQRHIDRLLTDAEDAIGASDWMLAGGRARQVLPRLLIAPHPPALSRGSHSPRLCAGRPLVAAI